MRDRLAEFAVGTHYIQKVADAVLDTHGRKNVRQLLGK